MNLYRVRYIHGSQDALKAGPEELVRATDVDQALRTKSAWPIERSMDRNTAWAKNPGTSLYHVEAWEASLAEPAPRA
ncbi:hypothetical protein JCM15519_37560 [Fundidesulfovibrio butyratiphilus]